MRMTLTTLLVMIALLGCNDETTPKPEPQEQTTKFSIEQLPEFAREEIQEHIDECGQGVIEGESGENVCSYTVDAKALPVSQPEHVKTGLLQPKDFWKHEQFVKKPKAFKGELPLRWDWREQRNGICPGEKQGSCGSCWMFGTMHVMQNVYKLQNPDKACIDISSQWGVDCEPDDFYGCRGGYYAFNKFKLPNYGAVYTQDYGPYQARDMSCKSGSIKYDKEVSIERWNYVGDAEEYVTGNIDERGPTVEQIMHTIYDHGPVAITERAFASGVKGIYHRCSPGGSTNHITTLVGWTFLNSEGKEDPNGDLYWLRQNSWAGTGDPVYGVLTVKATSGKGTSGSKCQNMGETAAYVEMLEACEPQPVSEAGDDQILIKLSPSASVLIGGEPKEGHTYEWEPKTGLNNPFASKTYASPDKSTTYTLKATTECGEATSVATVSVLVPVKKGK